MIGQQVLREDVASDPERVARFEREARAVAALQHPNIVTIHSVERIEGRICITMELVSGKTLAELIPPAGLPLERSFDLGIPLAEALRAAHARGITHRDLKPSNVMVDDEGRLRVLDFGLAKAVAAAAGGDSIPTEDITAQGRILGTVTTCHRSRPGNYHEAIDAYEQAIRLDPRDAAAHRGLAQAQVSVGQPEQAEATYLKAIELRPDYWDSHAQLGKFYWSQGDYEDAVEQLRKAVELTPDNYRAYNNLGGCALLPRAQGRSAGDVRAVDPRGAQLRGVLEPRHDSLLGGAIPRGGSTLSTGPRDQLLAVPGGHQPGECVQVVWATRRYAFDGADAPVEIFNADGVDT